MRALSSGACMVTAVTIWWGCWQWAHEANAPRVAQFVEEQAPGVVEASRADYNELLSLTQVVTNGERGQEAGVAKAAAVHKLAAAKAPPSASSEDTPAWPADEHALLTFTRAVTDLVMPGVLPMETRATRGADERGPVYLGEFDFTYYWITSEHSFPGERTVQLYGKDCKPLKKVTPKFAERLALEGTGKLTSGRTLNVDGECECGGFSPCFFVTRRSQRWGVGAETRPLVPFRSVAVDTDYIPIGTRMYIPELDGLTVPGRAPYGGFVHDGCVVADDTGGSVDDEQIDIFFALKGHYEGFDHRHRIRTVRAYRNHERCADTEQPAVQPGQRMSV